MGCCDEITSSASIEALMADREAAISGKQFIPYYQPQYNHSTGMIVGAEALTRWKHPEFGMVSPALFIRQFEEDGFISKVDLAMFEQVCAFLRRCIDSNCVVVPVSVNISRRDLSVEGFVSDMDAIRAKYGVPTKFIRIEITESIAAGGIEKVSAFITELHKLGYVVEMDDFGSGLSSLNALKELDFDMIKLDMNFLGGDISQGKSGTILSSVVRMCKWLGLPVIAEGVKTVQQADFMRSIGCDYIQGYLYSGPISGDEYIKKLSDKTVGALVPEMTFMEKLDVGSFWSPDSQETLIFNNYVGGAAVFEYKSGSAEIFRVNQKFLKELGMNMSEKDIISRDPLDFIDANDRPAYEQMLKRAIESGDEEECEAWRTIKSACCGEEHLCIRSTVRLIGKSPVSYLFYETIRNITAEKMQFTTMLETEKRFKMASEQVNIYFWEYTVATHEMRPCFRCMRDLGLPPLVTNYPDTAIEMGIFPPEVADMYRDWHRQIEAGVPSLEAVIPLTVGRVPFLVRYTTEFDDLGNPVKAYGSAALVVD